MKSIRKNKVVILVAVLMLVVAGYLNYTTPESDIQVSSSEEYHEFAGEWGEKTAKEEKMNGNKEEKESDFGEAKLVNSEVSSIVKTSDEYFAKSKLEREKMYSQMLETYEKILNSTNIIETQRQSAIEEMAKMNKTRNSIMVCENLIKLRGFEDVVLFANGESISVIVKKANIKPEEIAQIQNIVSREMSTKIENINISSK